MKFNRLILKEVIIPKIKIVKIYKEATLAWLIPDWINLWYKWSLWALNMFCLLLNLRIIQVMQSNQKGLKGIIKIDKFENSRFWVLKIENKYNEAKKVLPISPIKTLEGNQLK